MLVVVIVGVGVAAAYSLAAEKQYEAEADLLVTPVAVPDNAFLTIQAFRESSDDPTRTVVTLARIIKTPQAAVAAREAENLDLTQGQLLGAVEVTPVSQSNLITIKATASDPELAAKIANGFAEGIVDVRTKQFQAEVDATISRLEQRVDAIPATDQDSAQAVALQQSIAALETLVGTSDPTIQIAAPAEPPSSPSWPRPVLSVVVAFLAALLLGAAIALTLELVSPRINREEELLFEQRLPILARVPRLGRRAVRDYLARRKPLPPEAWESYRTLRMNLATASPGGRPPKTILVTSSLPREGKTMTSVNLASSIARSGQSVILVDGDYRRPMLGAILGISSRNPIPSFLEEPSALPSLLVPVADVEGLALLPARPEHSLMIDQLDSARARRFFDTLSELADVVIIDSAPITEVADTLPLADAADAVVIAVRLGHTRRDRLLELRRMLGQHGVVPTGFVVTSRRARAVYGSYYPVTEPARKPAPEVRSRREARQRTA
jgi:Mrp family chromosome partitioning ATPase/capsular polysaccharide biosynthesis protein